MFHGFDHIWHSLRPLPRALTCVCACVCVCVLLVQLMMPELQLAVTKRFSETNAVISVSYVTVDCRSGQIGDYQCEGAATLYS